MDFRFKYSRDKAEPPSAEQLRRESLQRQDNARRLRGLAFGISIPTLLAGGPLSGWLLGTWLDRSLGTSHWMLILIILGTITGMATTIRMLSQLNR